jgi:hypothetical protein
MTKIAAPTKEQLTEIAWSAIRASFPADQIEDATIEFRESMHSTFHVDDQSYTSGLLIEVWLMHPNIDSLGNPDATADATGLMVQELNALGYEDSLMLLYHGFPNSPSRRRQAA